MIRETRFVRVVTRWSAQPHGVSCLVERSVSLAIRGGARALPACQRLVYRRPEVLLLIRFVDQGPIKLELTPGGEGTRRKA